VVFQSILQVALELCVTFVVGDVENRKLEYGQMNSERGEDV